MSISKKLMTAGGGPKAAYVDDVFSTYLYTGGQSKITNGIDLTEGGMVWIKNRSSSADHWIADSVNNAGTGNYYYLSSNTTNPVQYSPGAGPQEFLEDGFIISGGAVQNNTPSYDYASWTFRKAEKFFDIVKYTGTASGAGITIPHNLGTTPGVIIVKPLVQAGNWHVYHKNVGANQVMYLNYDSPSATNSGFFPQAPDENNFYVGPQLNQSDEYVAYIFAHDDSDESLIKCGIATYNGSAPTEVDLGFEPQFILLKSATVSEDWYMVDSMRGLSGTVNGPSNRLNANKTDAEYEVPYLVSANSNGFTIGTGAPSARQYIYMAIRRPNKPADNFEADELFNVGTAVTNEDPTFQSNFPADFGMYNFASQTGGTYVNSRLLGTHYLDTTSTGIGTTASLNTWDWMNGFGEWRTNASGATHWNWRRVPGFFDVVAYGGTGAANTQIPHNLGVAPEMMWVKRRDFDNGSMNWCVYHKDMGANNVLNLNLNYSAQVGSHWAYTDPTDTHFNVGSNFEVNYEAASGGAHVAYLFASVPGVSKVGSYTGTGATQFIDCGFTNSCRFVLIKRVDGTGDWMVVDTERGFISGMNPFIFLNSNAAQVNDFRVYPNPQGFQVSNDGSVSTVGAEYLFYAIA